MAQADNIKKAGTGKSAIGIAVIALMIVVIAVAIGYALMQPGVLESVLHIAIIAIIVIVAIIVIGYIVMAIIAVPMYAYKGEQYQEGVDYNLKDIESVKEVDSEDEGKDL